MCSSALSEQIPFAETESPPWTGPLVSYSQTQKRTVSMHMCRHRHTPSDTQYNVNRTKSAKTTERSKPQPPYNYLSVEQSKEIRRGQWEKNWSVFQNKPPSVGNIGKQKLKKHRFAKEGENRRSLLSGHSVIEVTVI